MAKNLPASGRHGRANTAGLDRRRLLGLAGAAAAASVLPAPVILRAQARDVPEKIQIGYLPANTILMVFNQGAGIWREQGLNVEFTKFAGGPAILNALASASIPAAEVGVGPALLAAMKGAPFQFFTLGSIAGKGFPFSRIMVSQDSAIRSFKDLEGKTLALHQRGTMEHVSLGAASAKYELAADKMNIALVPLPNQPQVLAQKQVDAVYSVPPFDVIAEEKFGARTLVETTDFLPYLGYSTLALHKDFVASHPEAVKRLIKAWILFSRWVDDHTVEARQASGKFLGVADDVAPRMRVPYYARNGLSVIPNVWHTYQMFIDAKVVEPDANVGKVIDEYFIQPTTRFTIPALQELGRVPDPLVKDFLNTPLPLLPKPTREYFAPWEEEFARL